MTPQFLAYPLRGSVVPFMEIENSCKVPWGGQGEDDRFGFAHVGCKVPLPWRVRWRAG